jgi:hypothetical protein
MTRANPQQTPGGATAGSPLARRESEIARSSAVSEIPAWRQVTPRGREPTARDERQLRGGHFGTVIDAFWPSSRGFAEVRDQRCQVADHRGR